MKKIIIATLAIVLVVASVYYIGAVSPIPELFHDRFFPDKTIEETGKCGEDVTWTLNKKKRELVISGKGDMWDYNNEEEKKSPFYSGYDDNVSVNDDIVSVKIEDGVTSIGDGAFESCESMTNVTIPDSVTSIGDSAFMNCTNLKNIVVPGSVTRIGNAAFSGCHSLKEFIIPDGVTSIGNFTFSSCFRLESISIPDSVTSIGIYAFLHCDKLHDIYYYGTKEQWNAIKINISALGKDLETVTIHCYDDA